MPRRVYLANQVIDAQDNLIKAREEGIAWFYKKILCLVERKLSLQEYLDSNNLVTAKLCSWWKEYALTWGIQIINDNFAMPTFKRSMLDLEQLLEQNLTTNETKSAKPLLRKVVIHSGLAKIDKEHYQLTKEHIIMLSKYGNISEKTQFQL